MSHCTACHILLTDDNISKHLCSHAIHLCLSCHDEIEREIAEFNEEDIASTALMTAVRHEGLSCRPGSEPFDIVLLEGLQNNPFGEDRAKWEHWAITVGVPELKSKLAINFDKM